MALFLVTAAFADEVSSVKATSGEQIEVSNDELAKSYVAMMTKAHVHANGSSYAINDDGSITINNPVFHYDGEAYPFVSDFHGSDSDKDFVCAFFGFSHGVTSESHDLSFGSKLVVMQAGGQLQQLFSAQQYVHRAMLSLTCRN